MSAFLDLPLPFLLLLPISLAAGVDFFLTLLVVLVSQGLGWSETQEPGFYPLHWGVLACLVFLYLLEASSELRPRPAALWHTLQLLLRPVGGALVALTFLDGLPLALQLLGALVAAIVCAFTHVLSWGQKFLSFLKPNLKVSFATRVLAEDTLVLAFLILALERPDLGFTLSGALLLLGLLLGGSMHHAVRFGLLLVKTEVSGFLNPPRWRDARELPPWIRRMAGEDAAPGPRGMAAGVFGIPKPRSFQEGWLLEEDGAMRFVFRRRRKPSIIPLEPFLLGAEETLPMVRRVAMTDAGGGRSALFLQGKGPGLKSHKW